METRNSKQRVEQLVEENMGLACWLAYRWSQPTWIDLEEAKSVALEYLVRAAQAYDDTKNTKFTTYATFRIRGGLQDEYRKRGPVTRRGVARLVEVQWSVQRDTYRLENDPFEVEGEPLELPYHPDVSGLTEILSDREQAVVYLYVACEKPFVYISEYLGISESRACQIWHKALKKMRKKMAA